MLGSEGCSVKRLGRGSPRSRQCRWRRLLDGSLNPGGRTRHPIRRRRRPSWIRPPRAGGANASV